MTFLYFSGTISKTSCHLAIIEWLRPQNVDRVRVNYAKKTPVSRKTAEKTNTEPGSQPGDIRIATESVASICKLSCTPRKVGKKRHSFIRFSKLSCTMQVLIFSKIPLRSGNMAGMGRLNVTSCAPPGTAKTGTENGPQSGELLGAWLHVGPDTKSVT